MNLNQIAKKPFWDLFYKTPCMSQLFRLAFNDAIRYNLHSSSGGANGAIRLKGALTRPENLGLEFALKQIEYTKKEGNHITAMLSFADLIQLGAYAALEYCEGPEVEFKMGREDVDELETEDEGILSAENAVDVQFANTGLTDEEIVALMGRRTLGFLPPEDEYQGRWCQNPYVFDNTYFQELLIENTRYIKLEDDRSLIDNQKYRKYVEMFAEDQELFFDVFARAFVKVSEFGQEEKMLSEYN